MATKEMMCFIAGLSEKIVPTFGGDKTTIYILPFIPGNVAPQ